jgi:Right handed beta helix region/Protein of unknown function (DUF1565)
MKQLFHFMSTRKKIGIGSLILIVIILFVVAVNLHSNPSLVPHEINSQPILTPHVSGKIISFVSHTGDDNNDGSRSNPFSSIEKAATMAIPGTVIHVLPGNYTSGLITHASGTPTSPITYISDIKWGAKIDTTGVDVEWDNRGNYVNIIGFDITGDGTYGILNRGSHVHMIGNYIHNISATKCSPDGGAGIADGPISGHYIGYDNYILGNIVHDIGPKSSSCNYVHGIYEADGNAFIQNNIVYNNAAWGIHTWHVATNDTISNNLVFGNGVGGILIAAHNAIDDYSIVTNNIVVNNAKFGIHEYGNTGLHNQFIDNLVYANPFDISLQNGNKAQGTLMIDPQFIDFRLDGSGNYHLKPNSPAMYAGTNIGAPQTDINGNPRPKNKVFELGPY